MEHPRVKYIAWLRKHGFEHIGGGLHSSVWAKPGSNRCIKIGARDRWPDYIQWASKHGFLGTFAPMVYSFKQHKGFYVAVMERLVCTIGEIDRWATTNSEQKQFYREARKALGFDIRSDIKFDTTSTFNQFCATLRDNRLADDCHDGNFMLRSDGQLVLIDPISTYPDKPSKLRIKNG